MILHQLSFNFNLPVTITDARHRRSWRVDTLARRYQLSPSQAAIYASEMRLPTEER